uniref:Uncharacterized protein n=4 Tax=Oryza TaxID=4527 RepID=A0A0D3EJ98_9ORYZ
MAVRDHRRVLPGARRSVS